MILKYNNVVLGACFEQKVRFNVGLDLVFSSGTEIMVYRADQMPKSTFDPPVHSPRGEIFLVFNLFLKQMLLVNHQSGGVNVCWRWFNKTHLLRNWWCASRQTCVTWLSACRQTRMWRHICGEVNVSVSQSHLMSSWGHVPTNWDQRSGFRSGVVPTAWGELSSMGKKIYIYISMPAGARTITALQTLKAKNDLWSVAHLVRDSKFFVVVETQWVTYGPNLTLGSRV